MTPDFNSASAPDLDLAVYDTASLAGYHDKLEAAISLLSKSEVGRHIAQDAIAKDYVIVVEDAPANETPEQYKTRERGSVDHEQKIIFIRKENDVASLALTLLHELAHVRQHVSANLKADFEDQPATIIRKLVAMEADARAVEIAFAISLYKTNPELLDKIAERGETHGVATLAEKLKARDDISCEDAMAERFLLYYHAIASRERREIAALSAIARAGTDAIRDEKLFTRETDIACIARMVQDVSCIPYLERQVANGTLANPFYSAVAEESFADMAKIQKYRRENPALKDEAPWDCHVYRVMAEGTLRQGPQPPGPATP